MINKESIILRKNNKIVKEIFWNNYPIKEKYQVCLTDYIEENSKQIRKKLLFLLEDIESQNAEIIKEIEIRENFSFWNLTNFKEKNLYKKNNFFNIAKVISLIEVIENNLYDDLYIYIKDQYLDKLLHKIIGKQKIKKRTPVKTSFCFIKNIFYETLSLFRSLNFLITRIFYNNNKKKIDVKYNLFFSFFTYLDKKKFKEKIYRSLFWGKISKYTNINFVHLFISNEIIDNFNNLNKKITELNKNNELHSLLDSYVSLEMIYSIFKVSFKLKIKHLFIKNKYKFYYKNYNLSRLLIFDLRENFYLFNITKKLYYFYLFESFFKKNNFKESCFYIHENQPWEKSLIYHWKKNHNKKIYGVINSSVRFWDLRFAKNTINPDFLLTNGADSFSKVIEFGYNKNEIFNVESLRYQNKSSTINKKFNKDLLIVFDYSKISNNYLLSVLNKTNTILDYNIYFKEHPLSKLGNIKCNFNYKFIDDQFIKEDYNLIICTNRTTAQIDFLNSGFKVAIFLEPNSFNFSPLKGNKECDFFKTSDDLTKILNKKIDINTNIIKDDFFLTDKNYKEWNKILYEKK